MISDSNIILTTTESSNARVYLVFLVNRVEGQGYYQDLHYIQIAATTIFLNNSIFIEDFANRRQMIKLRMQSRCVGNNATAKHNLF